MHPLQDTADTGRRPAGRRRGRGLELRLQRHVPQGHRVGGRRDAVGRGLIGARRALSCDFGSLVGGWRVWPSLG